MKQNYMKVMMLVSAWLMLGIGAMAQNVIGSEAGEGTFYLYSSKTGQFLNTTVSGPVMNGHSNATTATLTATGDGTFLVSGISGCYMKMGTWNGQYLWCDGAEGDTKWNFEPCDEVDGNGYHIYAAEGNYNEPALSGTWYLTAANATSNANLADVYYLLSEQQYLEYCGQMAQTITVDGSEVAEGTFYLYCNGTGQFLNTTVNGPVMNNYDSATTATLTTNGDDTYLISGISGCFLKMGTWNGQYLWCDGTEGDTKWTFEPCFDVEGNGYYISTTEGNYAEQALSGTWYLRGSNATDNSNLRDVYFLLTEEQYADLCYQIAINGLRSELGELIEEADKMGIDTDKAWEVYGNDNASREELETAVVNLKAFLRLNTAKEKATDLMTVYETDYKELADATTEAVANQLRDLINKATDMLEGSNEDAEKVNVLAVELETATISLKAHCMPEYMSLDVLESTWGGSEYDPQERVIKVGEDWTGRGWWLATWNGEMNVGTDYSMYDYFVVEFEQPTETEVEISAGYDNCPDDVVRYATGTKQMCIELNAEGKNALLKINIAGPAGAIFHLKAAYFCTRNLLPSELTGIKAVKNITPKTSTVHYSLIGHKVPDSYRGIVITSDGRKIFRR